MDSIAATRFTTPISSEGRIVDYEDPLRSWTILVHVYIQLQLNPLSRYIQSADFKVLRGRPIIVEWERDARHSAGLSRSVTHRYVTERYTFSKTAQASLIFSVEGRQNVFATLAAGGGSRRRVHCTISHGGRLHLAEVIFHEGPPSPSRLKQC
ncbi:hypothetical protein EVAR_94163_1 [Eumeta japonica]|uniref:Uncharacterized protein n=1 Tax=Eumeta variegata TaxID=151549 RepID=A0A4C1U6V1_EUMVA|nr:hypothetical protein EVAR_94163_1 [Eumeta japonica]